MLIGVAIPVMKYRIIVPSFRMRRTRTVGFEWAEANHRLEPDPAAHRHGGDIFWMGFRSCF